MIDAKTGRYVSRVWRIESEGGSLLGYLYRDDGEGWCCDYRLRVSPDELEERSHPARIDLVASLPETEVIRSITAVFERIAKQMGVELAHLVVEATGVNEVRRKLEPWAVYLSGQEKVPKSN